jgi:hypothetical protein
MATGGYINRDYEDADEKSRFELLEAIHDLRHLIFCWQDCCPQMEHTFFLSKSRARYWRFLWLLRA